MRFDVPLSDFQPASEAGCRLEHQCLVLNAGKQFGVHMIRAETPLKGGNRVRVTLVYRPTASCKTDIYLDHWGWVLVCRLSADGNVVDSGHSQDVQIQRRPDGYIIAKIIYWIADHRIGIGVTSAQSVQHHGGGADEYLIEKLTIETIPAEAVDEAERLVFVDVGARGGFSTRMQLQGARVRPILFEPDPSEAQTLRNTCNAYPGAQVEEFALFNVTSRRKLYLTREPGCSSLLPPNFEFVAPYPTGRWFDIVKEIEVDCIRYDELFQSGHVPAPDAIKIDVQGAEYYVLEGFGSLLQNCLGIELECHTYPLYHGEKLISDLTTFLAPFGLMLHRLHRVDHFLDEWIEFDAWFLRPQRLLNEADNVTREKQLTLKRAWRF